LATPTTVWLGWRTLRCNPKDADMKSNIASLIAGNWGTRGDDNLVRNSDNEWQSFEPLHHVPGCQISPPGAGERENWSDDPGKWELR
jgi:hypothetical protein